MFHLFYVVSYNSLDIHRNTSHNRIMKLRDITGMRFGKLVPAWPVGRCTASRRQNEIVWLCFCDCGQYVTKRTCYLFSGTKSCGCLTSQGVKKHGHATGRPSREYGTWNGMKQRCSNTGARGYKNYGGRGIQVCDAWSASFKTFFQDMGPSNGLTIDRIDNDGNYEPSNCRWATRLQQARNKTRRTV